jgi:hypothetical protein
MSVAKSGGVSQDISVATNSTTVIAHGLGAAPKFVHLFFNGGTSAGFSTVDASWTSSGSSGSSMTCKYTSTQGLAYNSGISLSFDGSFDTNRNDGVITVDATNITITWTKYGSPIGNGYWSWSAIA